MRVGIKDKRGSDAPLTNFLKFDYFDFSRSNTS